MTKYGYQYVPQIEYHYGFQWAFLERSRRAELRIWPK